MAIFFLFFLCYQILKNAEIIFIEGFLMKQTECLSMLRQMFHEYKFFNAPNFIFFLILSWTTRVIYFYFYLFTCNKF